MKIFGNVHILKPRPLCPLPLFCLFTHSRGHGSQVEPSDLRHALEVLFHRWLGKGGLISGPPNVDGSIRFFFLAFFSLLFVFFVTFWLQSYTAKRSEQKEGNVWERGCAQCMMAAGWVGVGGRSR